MGMHYTEDLTVMGNGIIGSLTALLAARCGMKVALCGPLSRPGAASTAAGAMLNVYGEIDGRLDDYTERKLKIGRQGIDAWKKILPPDIFVADRTEVHLINGASVIERESFRSMELASAQNATHSALYARSILAFEDEPAVDTAKLFTWLENELRQTVRILPNNWWQSGQMSIAPKTLWACGVWTPQALGMEKHPILPVFSSVGTAMVLKGLDIGVPPRTVVRSPNRGNTCGVHVVPRDRDAGEYYVGAGSFISREPSTDVRMETIHYLTNCLRQDFDADIWRATMTTVVGNRPVSLDGKPMLGPLKATPDYYVATGTKRDGLTYAPVIADDVIRWATNTERTGVFDGWEPDRVPISYGPYGSEAYALNRMAALQSHGKLSPGMGKLNADYIAACERAAKRYDLSDSFRLHPEIVAVM